MKDYTYHRGTENSRESVEFDIRKANGDYITTCVVDVDLLVFGVEVYPCGNGDDIKLTKQEQYDILTFAKAERIKIKTASAFPKNLVSWHESGLRTFEEYFAPGDMVTEDLVDYFVNIMPPKTMLSNCVQAGEVYSHEKDEHGNYRSTYLTFHKIGGDWHFIGYCFAGETKNRDTRVLPIDEHRKTLMAAIKAEAKRNE